MNDNFKNITWPGWETVRLIGRGSFGAVYEIQREAFGDTEKAALKVISIPQNEGDIDEMYSDGHDEESITKIISGHLESVVAEYTLMRKMNGCTNIVNCEDIRYVQHDDGIGWDLFIKMELLTPLTKSLDQSVSEETVIDIGKDICNALVICKQHNIIHRDIKPQNIFVSPYGDYKLGDFGIAKTVEKTMGGTKIGTYKYMAPEVYNNQAYGTTADIYSLGLVLYWLLNERRLPFLPLPPAKIGAGMEEDARSRRLSGETFPLPKHGSNRLKAVVMKACAYDPRERFHSAAEMLEALVYAGRAADAYEEMREGREPELEKHIVRLTAVQSGRHEASVGADRTNGRADGTHAVQKINKTDSQKKSRKNFGKLVGVAVVTGILLLVIITFFKSSNNKQISESENTSQLEDVTQAEATPSAPQDDAGENIVREERYASDGSVSGWIESEYNSDGKKIKETTLDSDGSVEAVTDYDTAGNKIKTTYESNGYITYITEYDSAGIKVKTTKYNPDGSSIYEWYEYEYDAAGNMTKETTYNYPDGSAKGWTEHEYDDAGNEIKETKYNPDGSIGSLLEYNSAGNLIKEIGYELDGSTTFWIEYEFDSAGNNVKRTDYNPSGTPALIQEYGESGNLLIQHGYDALGNEIETRYYNPDGSVNYWYGYEYDTAGNMLKEIYYEADGSVSYGYAYEYDTAGNRVKSTLYNRNAGIDYWTEYEYDAAGNKVKETNYKPDGKVNYWYRYEYDPAGNLGIETLYRPSGIRRDSVEYNFAGKVVRRIHYKTEGVIDSLKEYDAAENLIKATYYNSGGDISRWVENEYDAAGNMIKSITYNHDGSIDRWYIYEYDVAGNQVKEIGFSSNGSISYAREYEYDADGNEVKKVSYYADGRIDRTEYEYDAADNLVKRTFYYDGNIHWTEYEYDEAGNELKRTDSNGFWIEYEYDAAGNLAKRTTYNSGGGVEAVYEYNAAGNEIKETHYNSDGSLLYVD